MTVPDPLTPRAGAPGPDLPPWDGEASLRVALDALSPRAAAIFARTPLRDEGLPETSDVDVLAFGPVGDVVVERLWRDPLPAVDVIWLPEALLADPSRLARYGVMTQRLLTSTLAFDRDGRGDAAARAIAAAAFAPEIHAERLRGLLALGAATVGEIGVTWGFPALCRFWLQIAASAGITALGDAMGILAPNGYTRPVEAAARIAHAGGPDLRGALRELLDLPTPLGALRGVVRAMHGQVTARCPEPAWPEGYREDTPFEYRYYASARELEWRIAASEEMEARGLGDQAALWLRFYAYSLARIPMVRARVGEGRRVAFGRPLEPVGPDLARQCPQILPLLTEALGGDTWPEAEIRRRIPLAERFVDAAVSAARARGIPLSPPSPFAPYEPRQPGRPRGAQEAPPRA